MTVIVFSIIFTRYILQFQNSCIKIRKSPLVTYLLCPIKEVWMVVAIFRVYCSSLKEELYIRRALIYGLFLIKEKIIALKNIKEFIVDIIVNLYTT